MEVSRGALSPGSSRPSTPERDGDAPLAGGGPWTVYYFLTYALALGPAIIVVAALALMFECVPLLSGRLGDVLYFFLWAILLAMGAMSEGGGAGKYLDVMGLGFIMRQVHAVSNSTQLAIGMTPFRRDVAPWVLPPIPLSFATLLPRLTVALLSVPILMVARLFFHRFDPARVQSGRQGSGDGLIRRISTLTKPITRIVSGAGAHLVPAAPAVLRPVLAETVMTLCQSPLVVLAWLAVVATTIVSSNATARHALPRRRHRARRGTRRPRHARPCGRDPVNALQHAAHQAGLRLHQAGGAVLLALLFCIPPAIRIAFSAPGSALSLVIAAGFMGALATRSASHPDAQGIHGGVHAVPLSRAEWRAGTGLDFAGWNGVATGSTRLGYMFAAALFGLIAVAKHRWDVAREN